MFTLFPPPGLIRLALAAGILATSATLATAQAAPGREDADAPASDATARPADGTPAKDSTTAKEPASKEPEHVYKTDAEWQRLLTPNQYLVTRLKATEPAFSGRYATGHFKGTFLCVCCGAKLFDSRTKFESGTGWPSFWRPISAGALGQAIDRSEVEPRMEVTCARCGAHLGHVFNDGPPPTGLRYCINSLSLKLDAEPTRSASPSRRAPARTRSTQARDSSSAAAAPSAGAEAKPKDPA